MLLPRGVEVVEPLNLHSMIGNKMSAAALQCEAAEVKVHGCRHHSIIGSDSFQDGSKAHSAPHYTRK